MALDRIGRDEHWPWALEQHSRSLGCCRCIRNLCISNRFAHSFSVARQRKRFVIFQARDAYLSRDWVVAETTLRTLLIHSPTDGEAQLLLASLLKRVDRVREAREALHKLRRSDSGKIWATEIARELLFLDRSAVSLQMNTSETNNPLARKELGQENLEPQREEDIQNAAA